MENPCFDEKVRLRTYQEHPAEDSQVFLEIKKKTKNLVTKRRLAADLLTELANMAGEAAANIPRTGVSGKRWLAIFGAGALIVSGSVFAYNSLHKEEEAFTADGGEEFAQVCQDAKTGRRVEDSECEKAGEAANSSDSSSSSNSNSSSHNNSGSNSNSGTHNNQSHVTNAFLWYYIGSQAGRNENIPAVRSSLTGSSTSRPSSGTVYSGVSSLSFYRLSKKPRFFKKDLLS